MSSASSSIGASTAQEGITDGQHAAFLPVPVVPWFGPEQHAAVFQRLQTPPKAKLLDLTPLQELDMGVFDSLAAAWTAPGTAAPRLGILLPFERWVMLRSRALAALQPLADRGIRLEVFYEEQAWGGQLAAWFRHGAVVHNLAAVIAKLSRRWQPSSESWPTVIETLARLVRRHTSAAELVALLTEVAELALSCGGETQAEALAREALYYLGEAACATRSKALRVLGAALVAQGQTAAGSATLEQAIAMAAGAKAPAIEASALCQCGLLALNHGDAAGAEQRFRRAIDLLAPSPHLLAVAHHHLAIALLDHDRREAEHHAQEALALRADQNSHFAEADRMLLARLRATTDRGGQRTT